MSKPKNIFILLMLIALIVYLFVTAPPPLQKKGEGSQIEIRKVLEIINAVNAKVRNLYTQSIVGAGKKSGLKFDENWQDEDVFAGPLPAQFLRETSINLEKSNLQLGLYLGSDFPINSANLFSSKQSKFFQRLKQSGEPEFFYVEDINRYGYMFADKAIAKGCTQCHNEHDDSPKKDWELGDIMGATTWTYPDKQVSYEKTLQIISVVRSSIRNAYATYIRKTKQFKKQPVLSNRWPKEGFYLPTVDVFMQEVDRLISTDAMSSLMLAVNNKKQKNKE